MFRNPFDVGFSSSLILLFFTFFPLNEAVAQPDLEVSGIVVGEGESLAIVNGKMVKAGDEIDGVKVIEIGEGAVKFKYKDDVFIKQLGERDASLLLRNTRRYYKEANAETLDECKAILLYQKAIKEAELTLEKRDDIDDGTPEKKIMAKIIKREMESIIKWSRQKIQKIEKAQEKAKHKSKKAQVKGKYVIPVLEVKFFPVKDGRIDTSPTGEQWDQTLEYTRQRVEQLSLGVMSALQEGSIYHGYKNTNAKPSLEYKIVKTIELLKLLPYYKGKDSKLKGDYHKIMNEIDIKYWVEERGVKEVWIWAYPADKVQMWESNMSSRYGDISNSNRDRNDLPVLKKTYTVYGYNYARGVPEAIENHMHQIESVLRHIDYDLFWKKFVGYFPEGKWSKSPRDIPKDRRCGWSHYPPNAESDYDWSNKNYVWTDIENWKPDGGGKKIRINCDRWQGDNLKWFIYWMQNIPGENNRLTYKGRPLLNWWIFIADFDYAMKNKLKLVEN